MLRTTFPLFILFALSGVASAVCPERPVPLCAIVAQSEVVVRAKVASVQRLVDEDDPDGVAGWIYHLNVIKDYRHKKTGLLAVMSENTSSRVSLESGKEYIVFAGPNAEGRLETGNFCDPYSANKFDQATEQKVLACLRTGNAW